MNYKTLGLALLLAATSIACVNKEDNYERDHNSETTPTYSITGKVADVSKYGDSSAVHSITFTDGQCAYQLPTRGMQDLSNLSKANAAEKHRWTITVKGSEKEENTDCFEYSTLTIDSTLTE